MPQCLTYAAHSQEQLQKNYWPNYVFKDLTPAVTIAVVDTGMRPDHVAFNDIEIHSWGCLDTDSSATQCQYYAPKTKIPYDIHGTAVGSIAAKYMPGIKIMHNYIFVESDTCGLIEDDNDPDWVDSQELLRQLDIKPHNEALEIVALNLIAAAGIEHVTTYLLVLRTIAANLHNFETEYRHSGKKYAYVVNQSWGDGFSQKLIAKLKANAHKSSFVREFIRLVDSMNAQITNLHHKYPRFQMINSAGNDACDELGLLAQHPEIIVVGSHDEYYRQSEFSNYGPKVLIAALGEDVQCASAGHPRANRKLDGTSFSTPAVVGVQAVLMALISDLSNTEAKSLLLELSVRSQHLSMPALSLDIKKICAIISERYMNRTEKDILVKLKEYEPQHCNFTGIETTKSVNHDKQSLCMQLFMLLLMILSSASSAIESIPIPTRGNEYQYPDEHINATCMPNAQFLPAFNMSLAAQTSNKTPEPAKKPSAPPPGVSQKSWDALNKRIPGR